MKNLKLSVAALLVLFSSTALAAPAVSTSAEAAPIPTTAVEQKAKSAKNKASSPMKKVIKKTKSQKVSKKNKSVKKGANTALCKDGTYSKSKSRKGACSRHGGVSKWL
ncbi:DUF3761 domain-containing protein [Xenorhabdus nematophila]|uniref:DUF3761 domain-containing protein n=1 Tax=Xenorhabdus nematophila TaxID=628 RepID=UPI00032756BD|nr:DUF3761 domain-containing protein [Xenorhabdus nematophila]CEF28479.1 hypothetical protein; putative exported protein [Xenorhabdus nematophila str. Websteri]AYA39495.1 DUF3761 domain-containing protein [Xenorhabdus nematophila]MBA0018060.1 DUF3761 domain-containing protein [Xenorhabdus nematophila]MCB4426915.1 DUF3761 domain-containing protein [Xenorhabdus nematophila]QNJ37143.1 DUF3761 domain-containing protein [Xenorhabdus nematophila]